MARVLLGTVVAAAVLYHTVAGCCTHHDHRAVFGQTAVHSPTGGCCHSGKEATHRHRGDRHADHDHGTPPCSNDCPADQPSQHNDCQHGSCAFAVPDTTASLTDMSLLASQWLSANSASLYASQLDDQSADILRHRAGSLLLPGGARRHLALGVMLL